jgi:HSP20 family protein
MTRQPQYTRATTDFLAQPTQQSATAQPTQFAESASVQLGSQQSIPQPQPVAGQTVAGQTEGRQTTGQQMVGHQATEQQMASRQPAGQQATEQQVASQPQQASQPLAEQRRQYRHQQSGQIAQPQSQQLVGSSAQMVESTANVPGAAAQQSGMRGVNAQMAPTRGVNAQMASRQGVGLGTTQQTQAESAAGPVPKTGIPPIDVIDQETELSILADIPGFDEDDIEIKLEGDSLQIVASERVRDLSETETMVGQERPTAVSREIRLPVAVTSEDAEASYEDGVLSVELPKDEDEAIVGKQIGIQ